MKEQREKLVFSQSKPRETGKEITVLAQFLWVHGQEGALGSPSPGDVFYRWK